MEHRCTLRVKAGPSTGEDVTLRLLSVKLNALYKAFMQCATLVVSQQPKITGRPSQKINKLAELIVTNLKPGSAFIELCSTQKPDNLFTDEDLDLVYKYTIDLSRAASNGTLLEKAREMAGDIEYTTLAKPFYELTSNAEDDSTVELVFPDTETIILDQQSHIAIGEWPGSLRNAIEEITAITKTTLTLKPDDTYEPLAISDYDLIEVPERRILQTGSEFHISDHHWTYVEFETIRLILSEPILVSTYRGTDYFRVTVASNLVEAIDVSREDAIHAFSDLFVSLYLRYKDMEDSSMASRAIALSRWLKNVVLREERIV